MKKSDRSQAFPRKSVVNKHIALVYVAIVPVGRGLVDYKPYFCMDFGLTLNFDSYKPCLTSRPNEKLQ